MMLQQNLKHVLAFASLLFVLLGASSAFAGVCVEVDEERDNLDDKDARAIRVIVEGALEEQGKTVVDSNCEATYTAYNIRLGEAVIANLRGPEGSRKMKAERVEELPEVYSQLASALIQGKKVGTASANRNNVTKDQANPERIESDSIFYLQLGYGIVLGGDIGGGPSPALGWRYELDQWAIDISLSGIAGTSSDAAAVSLLRIGGEYFFDGVSSQSFYLGAAFSYGMSSITEQTDDVRRNFEGSGMQGEVALGYEMFRASDIRLFLQANAVLPFYTAEQYNWYPSTGEGSSSRYTPSFGLSIGAGF